MFAVVRVNIVARLQSIAETDDGGLFAQIEMAIAADFGFVVHLLGFFFKATNQHHLVIVVEERIALFPLR